jgi:hypothetical protein
MNHCLNVESNIQFTSKPEYSNLRRDEDRSYLECCLSGVRHRDGMTLIQAFAWNMGDPGRAVCQGVGASHSSCELSVMDKERRACIIRFSLFYQPAMGGIK